MYKSEQLNSTLTQVLTEVLQVKTLVKEINSVGGGSINQAFAIDTNRGLFFIKSNNLVDTKENFLAESRGLELLSKHCPLKVPHVFGSTSVGNTAYLIMEMLGGQPRSSDYWANLGSGLATLHRATNQLFGLEEDNFIGSLRQFNSSNANWADFFINQRLKPQIKWARDSAILEASEVKLFECLFSELPNILPVEPPALLHGDLWNGNVYIDNLGEPALIDPAVYFGHREMDLAFTQMFGGFDRAFYTSYEESYPLSPGYEHRIDIHNIYPALVHLNLFGRAYWSQIKQTLARFT